MSNKVDRAHERLDKHGEQIDDLQDCIAKLTAIVDSMPDHEERLRALEQRGAKRWDAITLSAMTGVVAIILGALIGKVI